MSLVVLYSESSLLACRCSSLPLFCHSSHLSAIPVLMTSEVFSCFALLWWEAAFPFHGFVILTLNHFLIFFLSSFQGWVFLCSKSFCACFFLQTPVKPRCKDINKPKWAQFYHVFYSHVWWLWIYCIIVFSVIYRRSTWRDFTQLTHSISSAIDLLEFVTVGSRHFLRGHGFLEELSP